MRIAIHAKVLSEKQPAGIGIYTYNLLKAISSIDDKNQYVLYSNEPIVQKIIASNFKEKILKFPKLWSYLCLPFEFISDRFDLLFVPKEMVPPLRRPKTVIVCYDFGRLVDPWYRTSIHSRVHFWIATHYALKAADKIIAVSKATKEDIIKICNVNPDKIIVVYPGYDEVIYKPCRNPDLIEKVKWKYRIKGNYIINVSSILWYRKNLIRLIKAFHILKKKLKNDHKLVITGKRGEAYREIINLIYSLSLETEVILTDYIPVDDMPVLLSGAEVLVFPSLYEGFGLPLVEAMSCGCPVITSNVSSMPEVVGEAGMLVNPYSEEEIAVAIEKVISNSELKVEMCEKGHKRARMFSWEKSARETLRVFESLK